MANIGKAFTAQQQPSALPPEGTPGGVVDSYGVPSGGQPAGWHPPMVLPTSSSPEQSAVSSDQGGFLNTVGKIAGNPLLLSALRGYASYLNAPRGSGPITRAVSGLAGGLGDYFVEGPYRQAVIDRMKAQSAAEQTKAQATATKTRRKEEARGQISPEEQRALDLGQSYESIHKGATEEASNLRLNNARADQWGLLAQQEKDPQRQQMYSTMEQSLRAAGGVKVPDAELKSAADAARENNKDAFYQAHTKFEEGISKGNLAVSQGNLGVAQGNLGERKTEFGEKVKEYKEGAPLRQAELEGRQASARETQARIPKAQMESDEAEQQAEWLARQPQPVQDRFHRVKAGLEAKPTAAGKEATENIEFPDPHTGMNVSMTVPKSQIMSMQRPSKYSEKEKAGISIVKSAHGLSDMLRDALGTDPDKRNWATRQIQYRAYQLGVPSVAMGDKRKEIISLVAGAYQKLASEAATTAGLRNFGFIEKVTPHFPNPSQSDDFNRGKLDILDKILDQDAESLRTPGIIKDPEKKRKVEEQLYSQFGPFYQSIQGAGQPPTSPAGTSSGVYIIKSGPHAGEKATLVELQQRVASDPSYADVDVDAAP